MTTITNRMAHRAAELLVCKLITDKRTRIQELEKNIAESKDVNTTMDYLRRVSEVNADLNALIDVRHHVNKIHLDNEPIAVRQRIPNYIGLEPVIATFRTLEELRSIPFIRQRIDSNFKRLSFKFMGSIVGTPMYAVAWLVLEQMDGSVHVIGMMDAVPEFLDEAEGIRL